MKIHLEVRTMTLAMQAPWASRYREPLEGRRIWGVVCSTLSTTLEARAVGNGIF